MAGLSLIDVGNAVSNPKVCIKVPSLISGYPEKAGNMLVCSSGSFGIVYKFNLTSGKKALRIWHKDLSALGDIPKRTESISTEISNLRSDYFVSYDYHEKGILVNGIIYPLVIMDWCNGVPIKEYIKKHLNDKQTLQSLAKDFLVMIKSLHSKRISHGDLQHGNILITNNHKIKLIDYDSMCVPSIEGKKELIKGMPNYQHPVARERNTKLSPKVDYFSEIIIYLGIWALSENPQLWNKYNVEKRDDCFLFDSKDYQSFKHSDIVKDISRLGKLSSGLLDILEKYLEKSTIDDLEPFYIVAQRMGLRLPSLIESHYCIYCGSQFENESDNYCVKCGTKRCDL